MMVEHRSVRMELMSSRQVQEYLRTNDMAVLPVGCFEMHGPDIPLGCDGFHAWAQAILLAEAWKCLALPPVFFTFPGASGPWSGTVDLSADATRAYVQAVAEALLKNGFRRVVLCGTHGPLGPVLECVVRDIFQRTGNIVLHVRPALIPKERLKEALGYGGGEDVMVLASLKILGLHGAYEPATKGDKRPEPPFESLEKLWGWRVTAPWTFSRDYQHTGLRGDVKLEDADKAIEVMRQAAAELAELPETFARYQQEMRDLYRERPWDKATIWTETK